MVESGWKRRVAIACLWVMSAVVLWAYLQDARRGFEEMGGTFHVFGKDRIHEETVLGWLMASGFLMSVLPLFSGKTWVKVLSTTFSCLWSFVFVLGAASVAGQENKLGLLFAFLTLLALLGLANVFLNLEWLMEVEA